MFQWLRRFLCLGKRTNQDPAYFKYLFEYLEDTLLDNDTLDEEIMTDLLQLEESALSPAAAVARNIERYLEAIEFEDVFEETVNILSQGVAPLASIDDL